MNRAVRSALSKIGWEGATAPDMWRRAIMVLNYGRVPRRLSETDRGFKMLLLDRQGRAEWFVRCSWAAPEAMQREVELLDVLRKDPFGAEHVPESRSASGDPLFVQASRFLGEVSYSGFIEHRGPTDWMQDVREVSAVSSRLMAIAGRNLERLGTPPSRSQRAEWLDADFATLAGAGLPPSLVDGLRRATEPSLDLPAELQHGDLWPANVLRAQGRWWLIDFAECGVVWSPLYDVMHLVATAPPAAGKLWYALAAAHPVDRWLEARWTLLREAAIARGLTETQLASCLLYYLVHLTAYRLRPGVEFALSGNLREELERVGKLLASSDWNGARLLSGVLS